MTLSVDTLTGPTEVAAAAARLVAELARTGVDRRGRFTFAVSGGRTPANMFAELATLDVPWGSISIFQVDERVASEGHEDRNLTLLRASLPAATDVQAMPVNDPDLKAAAAGYAASLPSRLDLIHLGLGPDGHTASLVPGDPVLEVTDRDVAVTGEYQCRRRMTMTYPVLDRACTVLWLVTGAEKAGALRRLCECDPSIPAGRVATEDQRLLCDDAAAAG
ncbi:6-phosphogluconolactonase [soil metagenome]